MAYNMPDILLRHIPELFKLTLTTSIKRWSTIDFFLQRKKLRHRNKLLSKVIQ